VQHYFLIEGFSGKFGTGAGEEYAEYNPVRGTYHPLWMLLVDVPGNNVLPRKLAELVVQSAKVGWQREPVILLEET